MNLHKKLRNDPAGKRREFRGVNSMRLYVRHSVLESRDSHTYDASITYAYEHISFPPIHSSLTRSRRWIKISFYCDTTERGWWFYFGIHHLFDIFKTNMLNRRRPTRCLFILWLWIKSWLWSIDICCFYRLRSIHQSIPHPTLWID